MSTHPGTGSPQTGRRVIRAPRCRRSQHTCATTAAVCTAAAMAGTSPVQSKDDII
ncbi:hypothetical protein [Streptomyces sp. NPDC058579]|uniref:hypothetical protein n=1 Tax=Streptomyces sp. NPDC058579 TaxID=3346548 RepID=UPI003667D20D